jgi:ABC-2 type transport system permease protein
MLANIFLKTTRDRATGVAVGTVAVAAMFALGMAVYRTIDVSFYYELPEAYLDLIGLPEGGDIGGLAFGALFNTIGALTLGGLAISMGTASIAGEEADGTIGLLLGNPKSRTHVLLSKAGSILLLMTLAMLLLWGVGYVLPLMLDVSTAGLETNALMFHMLVNTIFYGFLALAIGAWTGNGSTASGIAGGIMVIGWVAVGILPLIESIDWLARVFPWYYYSGSDPISNGTNWAHIAILVGASAVLAIVGYIGVNRRDLKSRSVKRTLLDRLRANPSTAKMANRIAGTARVSGIMAKTASEHQGLLVITGAIMFYMSVLIGVFWRFLPESIFDALESFPDAIVAMVGGANMASAEGWIQAEIFSLTAPVAGFALTIMIGSRALAGEEQKHTMDLLMANPLSRSRIIIEKAGTMAVYALLLGAITFFGVWLGALFGGAEVGWTGIAATSFLFSLLSMVIGGVALMLSAATGRTRIANYGALGVAIVSYFAFSFLPLSDQLASWAKLSPFYYFLGSNPLVNGMNWGHAGVLAGLTVLLIALAIPLFQRRDLRG